MDYRIVFMGSPEFSLPTLKALADHYSVCGVLTQPDRPAGRGRLFTPPPVKMLAEELGLSIIQPKSLNEPDTFSKLAEWNPDVIIVAAFGQMLRKNVLTLPRMGCVNVHASLLPRWRGAAPIQAAILDGDEKTGITIMKMDIGLDTGPIISQRECPIQKDETAESLEKRLAEIGAQLLIETLPQYLCGELIPQEQNADLSTYASMIQKQDGLLDLNQTAQELERKVRAFYPWPGTFIPWKNGNLKILQAHLIKDNKARPNQRTIIKSYPALGTADGWLVLDTIQPSGKKAMAGNIFLTGARNWISDN